MAFFNDGLLRIPEAVMGEAASGGVMDDFFIDESGRKESQPALGRAIRELRERQGNLTPEALAERAKVDVRLLEQIEAGEGGDFNAITHLRRALGVSARELAELHEIFARGEEGSGAQGGD